MIPSAGQTGESAGGACPQCGRFNSAEVFYCQNCRYPLHAVRAAAPGGNGSLHTSEIPLSGGSNGKAALADRFGPPLVLEHERPTQPRRKRVPIPWGMIGLSWLLLGMAYGISTFAQRADVLPLQVLAFFVAMLSVGVGSALLRERSGLARFAGLLIILVYVILQILVIRAMLPGISVNR